MNSARGVALISRPKAPMSELSTVTRPAKGEASTAFDGSAVEVLGRTSFPAGRYQVDRYRLRHRLFGGGWSEALERDVLERGHAAALLPYDPQADAIVLVEQFRIGALAAGQSPWMLEIVAGLIEAEDADAEAVARRESLEECGCRVGIAV